MFELCTEKRTKKTESFSIKNLFSSKKKEDDEKEVETEEFKE